MTIMDCHSSATARSEAPHATETNSTRTIRDALKRRAQSVINDRSIDPESRAFVRYALEINDPYLAELVRLADTGESIVAALERSEISETIKEDWSEERIERLADNYELGLQPATPAQSGFQKSDPIALSRDQVTKAFPCSIDST
jgi:hypothetical protein